MIKDNTIGRALALLAVLAAVGCKPTQFVLGSAPDGGTTDAGSASGSVVVTSALDFGAVACGTAAKSRSVSVENQGSAPVTFTAKLSPSDAPFAVHPESGTIVMGETALVEVTPRAIPANVLLPKSYKDVLVVTTDAPTDPPHMVSLSESASGAVLSFDTQSIPFGTVPVGTQETSNFRVSNSGNAPVSIDLDVDTGGPFLVSPGTTATLEPGKAVTADVAFVPRAATVFSGSVGVQLESGSSLCAALPGPITLSGTGENGGLAISTTTLDFGTTACGGKAQPQQVKLTNSGNAPLNWSLTVANTSPVAYDVSPMSGSLGAGDSSTVTVTPPAVPQVSSTQPNLYGDTMTIVTDVAGDQPHVVALKETAGGAVIAFAPTSVGFGDVPVGTTAEVPFQITNAGNEAAHVTLASSNAAFSFSPSGALTVSPDTPSAMKGAFAPGNDTSQETAKISASVGTHDVLCAPLPAPLAATGTGTNGSVGFMPSTLSFGNQSTAGLTACGTTAPAGQVTFSNAGNEAYTLKASLQKGNASPYTLSISPASGVVAPNGTATITVTPAPIPATSQVPGSYDDTLTVTTTVAGDTPHAISLSESAYGAILAGAPSNIQFPATPAGAEATFPVGITNTGNAPATLVWSAISPDVFSFDQNVVAAPGGMTTSSNAYFKPTSAEPYDGSATLGVTGSTILCQPLTGKPVSLEGTGTNTPTITVSPAQVNFNLVPCGTSGGMDQVTIENQGIDIVTWSASLAKGTSFALGSPQDGTIVPGGMATLSVTSNVIPVSNSTTTMSNAFGDTLTITTNAPNDSPHVIPVLETAQGAILSFSPSSLPLPVASEGQPVAFDVVNSGNVSATVSLTLNNSGPALLTLGPPASGMTTSGTPLQTSVTEASNSPASSNATVSLATAMGTVLCQPAPAPMSITAN